MSVPKLISPLLDGFVMGDAISNHDGVRCCPAMRVSDSSKYIVKIISLPASQTKLDALLLAGAFSDHASALDYYQQLSQDIIEEAVLLQRFSQLEGFVPYENWQLEPMEDDSGFDVYLLAPYRTTLDRAWRKAPLTHLQAVNLGLDLCSALAASRRSGWLYADLKPENICICPSGEYRIGDIGFLRLSSLDYAVLPERHHNVYTAPEITDAYSALNATLDTYALGLILYQAFNGGNLPESAPGQSFRAPEYADVQMAQIILKACAPDPADRWEDPVQMGQALVSYLQSNTVNDTPIIPQQIPETEDTPAEDATSDEISTEEVLAAVDQALASSTVFPEEPVAEETADEEPVIEETADEEPVVEETAEEEPVVEESSEEEPVVEELTEEAPAVVESVEEEPVFEEPAEEAPTVEETPDEEPVFEEPTKEAPTVEETPDEEPVFEEPTKEAPTVEETPDEELVFEEPTKEAPTVEETPDEEPVFEEPTGEAPIVEESTEELSVNHHSTPPVEAEEGTEDWTNALVSESLAPILDQADDLIAHTPPNPVIVPDAVDIPIPSTPRSCTAPSTDEETDIPIENVSLKKTDDEPSFNLPATNETEVIPPKIEAVPEKTEPVAVELPVKKKNQLRWLIGLLIALVLLAAAFAAGRFYYQNYYLQSIHDLQLNGAEDYLTVHLNTTIDNTLLTIYCTDTYGNTQKLPVSDNFVTFTGLKPSTRYKVHVEIDGFHKLVGVTSDTYITGEQTTISGFTAVAGDTDGSVILSFTVQGPEASGWNLMYSCPGEPERTLPFTGHMVNVTGLTPGQLYTFRLEPSEPLYVVGEDFLEYTATQLIYAQQLIIESFSNGKLTAVWQAPEGVTVNSWTVRCAGENGIGKTYVVNEPKAVFDDLDPAGAYTVQVTAEGMSVSATAFITANSVTIKEVTVDDSLADRIILNWTYQGTAPEGGWLVLYTASGETEQQVVRADSATATITPVIPGTSFTFTIQSADGSTVFGGTASYEAPAAETFAGFMVTAADLTFRLCRTPAKEAWVLADVPATDYVDTFLVGEKASFAITIGKVYGVSEEAVRTLAVIRDENGNVVDTLTVKRTWSSMWYKNFGKLDLSLPQAPGNYTIEVYFNEAIVTTQSFTIAEPVT